MGEIINTIRRLDGQVSDYKERLRKLEKDNKSLLNALNNQNTKEEFIADWEWKE